MAMESQDLPTWLRYRTLGLFLRANQNGDGYLNRGYAGVYAGLLFADNSEFRMGIELFTRLLRRQEQSRQWALSI